MRFLFPRHFNIIRTNTQTNKQTNKHTHTHKQQSSFNNIDLSLSVKIIADESTFFLCMLGLHPTPTNTFELSNSQNCKKTFFWRCHHHLKVLRPICRVATWHKDQLKIGSLLQSCTISEIINILFIMYILLFN